MKSKKIVFLEKILRLMAKVVIWKYQPKIIGISGSVGKTSAKDAISLVLSTGFDVRSGEKNYNNEIGIPLTIIGAKSGESSILGWSKVLWKWFFVIIFPNKYPEILILEMGIDRPGDMDYLLSFVSVDVGVLTDISGSHLEHFGSVDQIAKEKWKLIESVSKGKVAVVNIDNEKIRELLDKKNKKEEINGITFGFSDKAMVRATDVHFNYHNNEVCGISFKLNYSGKIVPVRLENIIAKHHLYAVLAGISVGVYFKINPIEIANALKDYFPPAGRMTLIEGINGSMIIDDTYNASRVSVLAALGILGEIKASRKIAVLGDMLELGETSKKDHENVLQKAILIGAEVMVTGKRMREAMAEVVKGDEYAKNLQGKIDYFESPMVLADNLKNNIGQGDLVLVKGSQSMRMEKVVEEIVAKTVDTEKILCRQSKEWKSRPFIQP